MPYEYEYGTHTSSSHRLFAACCARADAQLHRAFIVRDFATSAHATGRSVGGFSGAEDIASAILTTSSVRVGGGEFEKAAARLAHQDKCSNGNVVFAN